MNLRSASSVLTSFSTLPGPVKAVGMLGSGAGILAIFMMFFAENSDKPFWRALAIGIIAVAVIVIIIALLFKLRDKAKSGPFSKLLARAGSSAGLTAEDKARLDQLRQKFEEGVDTYRKAGKDLYSLPWYLLVGPAGSGKTEAIRRSNVPFPPGLQDQLQGVGGTISMNWWFTNQAVVLDTAGALFMQGLDGARAGEWKEFLKLLRKARTNAPINGLLLVISSESLLKDSAERIEETAGVMARQLDLVQRTLDVRFPVTVIVTKCDKIVGFRDFFETLNNPELQHQILGWSNPSELDEPFKPDFVDQHLDTVREKLLRRRMGLLQNPVHTRDANGRRTDEVDELFELPDNLMRIAPRLKRYLEMIFVAGEWSPKPLFLRGIYFTSSMREGDALDVTLAQVLGVEVESLRGAKHWDKEKAYFLRDVFMSKVFKERGLVTRATNVNKALAKQRAVLLGATAAVILVLAGVTALGYTQFNASLKKPGEFWIKAREGFVEEGAGTLKLIESTDKGYVYVGGQELRSDEIMVSRQGDPLRRRADLVFETADQSAVSIDPPAIAAPIAGVLGFGDGFIRQQTLAHRSVLEATLMVDLLNAARSKLQEEKQWGPDAVGALAQLVRLQSYAAGQTPAGDAPPAPEGDGKAPARAAAPAALAIDVGVLTRYVLTPESITSEAFRRDGPKLEQAVARAYPRGFSEDERPSVALLGGSAEFNQRVVATALDTLRQHLLNQGLALNQDLARLQIVTRGLKNFRESERALRELAVLSPAPDAQGRGNPRTATEYAQFESAIVGRVGAMRSVKTEIDSVVDQLGDAADDAPALASRAGRALRDQVSGYFALLTGALPAAPADNATEPADLSSLRRKMAEASQGVGEALDRQVAALSAEAAEVSPLLIPGSVDRVNTRAYSARFDAYRLGLEAVEKAAEDAQETQVIRSMSLVPALDAIRTWSEDLSTRVGAWGAWSVRAGAGSTDVASALVQDRDASVRLGRRIIELATLRRVSLSARNFVRGAETNVEDLALRVSALADTRIESAAEGYVTLTRPRVLMSSMARGEGAAREFDRQYHPAAAREVLTDWERLRALLQPTTAGQAPILGAEEILRDERYRSALEGAQQYARMYATYWRNEAIESSKPVPDSWRALGDAISGVDSSDVNEPLRRLRSMATTALQALPATMAQGEAFDQARRAVDEAFAGLDNAELVAQTRDVMEEWRRLSSASRTPDAARREVLDAYGRGDFRRKYFAVYRRPGAAAAGIRWWNDFQVAALDMLVRETQGGLRSARETLRDGMGIPLAWGVDTPELSVDQVRRIAAASETLNAAAGQGGQNVTPGEELPTEIQSLMRQLAGGDVLGTDPAVRAWFTRVRELAAILGDTKGLSATIGYATEHPATAPGDLANARDRYTYASLRVGGKDVGKPFNIAANIAIPAADAALLRLAVPQPAGSATEILLYRDDPARGGQVAGRVLIESPWSLLREVVSARGRAVYDPAQDVWRVMTVTEDGQAFFWITVKFDPKLPATERWPRPADWIR